jgi:hypothetical protein
VNSAALKSAKSTVRAHLQVRDASAKKKIETANNRELRCAAGVEAAEAADSARFESRGGELLAHEWRKVEQQPLRQ